MSAPDLVRATAFALAVEQALEMAERGMTPRQAIAAVGLTWGRRTPSWDDAVAALAYAWRRACAPLSQPERLAA